jgi:hypothetical protein
MAVLRDMLQPRRTHVAPSNIRAMNRVFGQSLLSNYSMRVFRKYSKVASTVLRLFDRRALLFYFHKTAARAIWVWPVQSQ